MKGKHRWHNRNNLGDTDYCCYDIGGESHTLHSWLISTPLKGIDHPDILWSLDGYLPFKHPKWKKQTAGFAALTADDFGGWAGRRQQLERNRRQPTHLRKMQPSLLAWHASSDSRRRLPQKDMMWLLSACTNFLVTASSMICFTWKTEVNGVRLNLSDSVT